ncbi:alpha/beta hydrolase [Fischerella thermalis CCMEE 5205]|nr:alpha/beta hydrolase [Fischerella thermalis CCMEE 5205]
MLRFWSLVFPNYQLPITNYQLPITYYLLPITYYQPTQQYKYSSKHDIKVCSED